MGGLSMHQDQLGSVLTCRCLGSNPRESDLGPVSCSSRSPPGDSEASGLRAIL